MFSATWPTDIQRLASEFLSDPVKVTIGSQDLSASHSVSQARAQLAVWHDHDNSRDKVFSRVLPLQAGLMTVV